jgi:XTP/dITP diphosphohydrolase
MITFVTTNPGKVREAAAYLDDSVEQVAFDYPEPQAAEFSTVAAHGARRAYEQIGAPVIVDDAGLSIDALAGFPGPFSSYVEETLGIERVAALARREDDQSAAFHAVVGYCDGGPIETTDAAGLTVDTDDTDDEAPPVALFSGVVSGRIVAPRGDGGFGYDPIFEHDGQTFAERSPGGKNAISHRGKALAAFAAWHHAG